MSLFGQTDNPFGSIPHFSIGGWDGWNYAIGSRMLLHNAAGDSIITYCILDSDYHTREEKEARANDAIVRGVQLHIWTRKEIENYLLVPSAISRLIENKSKTSSLHPTPDDISTAIEVEVEVENQKTETIAQYSKYLNLRDRPAGVDQSVKRATELVEELWSNQETRWAAVSGKKVLSYLSQWSKNKYGVSFSTTAIASEIRASEMPSEIVEVISAIENGRPFGATELP